MGILRQLTAYPLIMAAPKHKNSKAFGHPSKFNPNVNLSERDAWIPLMKACAWESLENVRK
jgi:hypothetical protein